MSWIGPIWRQGDSGSVPGEMMRGLHWIRGCRHREHKNKTDASRLILSFHDYMAVFTEMSLRRKSSLGAQHTESSFGYVDTRMSGGRRLYGH